MTNEKQTAAQALNDVEICRLPALLDTILPASEDGAMPSACETDFLSYLQEQAADFLPVLAEILDQFDNAFADQPLTARVAQVQAFSQTDAQAFDSLLFRIYDCYYQADRVRGLIGAQPGSPFPGGHVIPAGDFSSLEVVKSRGKGYRR